MPDRAFVFLWPVWGAAGTVLLAAENATVWGDTALRSWCIIGSMLGAMGSLYFSFQNDDLAPPKLAKRLGLKFSVSTVTAMLATPLIIRWRGWPADPDMLMGVSGGVALVAVGVLTRAIPMVEKIIEKRGQKFTDE